MRASDVQVSIVDRIQRRVRRIVPRAVHVSFLIGMGSVAGTVLAQAAGGPGPLTVHPTNPRYFADGDGQAVYLTGSHTWTNLQDEWTDSYNVTFDFEAYLDFLQANNHNFIRLWRNEMPQYKYEGDTEYRFSEPHPWMRVNEGDTVPGGAVPPVDGPSGGAVPGPEEQTQPSPPTPGSTPVPTPGAAPGGDDIAGGGIDA